MKQELKQLADISGHKILGNPNSEKGNIQEIDMGFGLSFSGGTVSVNLELNDLIDVTTNFPLNPTEVDDGKMLFYDHSIGEWTTDDSVTHGTIVINGKKASAGTISKGLPVYLVGFDADLHTVELANSTSGSTMPVIGFAAENMDSTNPKHIITFGKLTGIDTTSTVTTLNPNGETWTVNDALYISTTSGGLTKFRPTGGTTQIQRIAKVLRVSSTGGQLFIFNTARTAGLPNLTTNKLWIGNNNGQPIEMSLGDGFTLSSGTISVDGNYGNLYIESTGNYSTIRKDISASATALYSSVLSGCMNTSSGCYGSILNGRLNYIEGSNYNSILNGNSNTNISSSNSSVSNGTNNIIGTPSQYSTIDNGTNNNMDGCYSVILNGSNNDIETTSQYSIIGSGLSNVSVGSFNVINSGQSNTIDGSSTNISTGRFNTISGSYNNISTGTYNTISGSRNFIGSGSSNTLTGTCISVLGNSIVATYSNTTYVNKLIINDTPTTNNSNTNLLVRNSSGQIELREASSFSGTNFANSDLTLTASRTHQLNGNVLNINNGATTVFRINEFNDVIARGKGDTTNTHFGLNVLRSNSTGIQNTVFGQDITGISAGQVNAYFGYRTARFNNGTGNSFFGGFAGLDLTTGNNNVIIGRSAAFSTNAGGTVSNLENSIVIGETARVLNSGDVNTIVIGRNSRGLGSNTVVIGNSDITRTQLRGRVEMDTTTDGILLPRLTTSQMNAIASPATNTILYNTDLNGLYRYDGSAWVALVSPYGGRRYTLIKPNGTQQYYDTLNQVRLNWADGDVLHQFADETDITYINVSAGIMFAIPSISWNGNGFKTKVNTINVNGGHAFNIASGKTVYFNGVNLSSEGNNITGTLVVAGTLYNSKDTTIRIFIQINRASSYAVSVTGTMYGGNVVPEGVTGADMPRGLAGAGFYYNVNTSGFITGIATNFIDGTTTYTCASNIRGSFCNYGSTSIGGNVTFDKCTILSSVNNNGGNFSSFTAKDCTIIHTPPANTNTFYNIPVLNLINCTFISTGKLAATFGGVSLIDGGYYSFGAQTELIAMNYSSVVNIRNCTIEATNANASTDCLLFTNGNATNIKINNVTFVNPNGRSDLRVAPSNNVEWKNCRFSKGSAHLSVSGGTVADAYNNNPARLLDPKGFLNNTGNGNWFMYVPMTTAERDALTSVSIGFQIHNTTTNFLQVYNGSSWKDLLDLS